MRSNELKVALLLLAGGLVFFVIKKWFINKSIFDKHYTVYAVVENAQHLSDGAAIYYKGLRVGHVGKKKANDKYIKNICIPLLITEKEIALPKDVQMEMPNNEYAGGLGGINLTIGNDYSATLKNGDTILTNFAKKTMFLTPAIDSALKELLKKTEHNLNNKKSN